MRGDAEVLEFLCGLNGSGNAKSCAKRKEFYFSILMCVVFSEVGHFSCNKKMHFLCR